MLLVYFLSKPGLWVLPWILQAIGYFFILKKMELRKLTCLIPFLAERQMSKKLFSRMRSFYRPFIVAAVLVLAGYYLDPAEGVGHVFMYVALIVYGIFLLRLYWRLAKSFGKGRIFYIGLILLPPLFLIILGAGKKQYRQIELKPVKDHGRVGNGLRRVGLVLISAVEILVLVLGVGLISLRTLPPSLLVSWEHAKVEKQMKDIKPGNNVISREDMMGDAAASLHEMKPSRELYFPDHAKDQNVVVLSYIVGSNLEHQMGLASANIKQMAEATKKGDNLTFIMEAGGAKRWFTKEIEDSSYGRYEIKGGKISEVEALPDNTCMSEEKELSGFLKWAKEKYPADRYMLVLWDHGGGVAYGYGADDLNKLDVGMGTIRTSQVVDAVADSGITFDMIGFDACLMQDIEVASALEPYTDYYMASEEVEGGFGWYYTDAFGKLAEDPTLPTPAFGKILLSEYDQLNTILKDENGEPDTMATLSLVDTTMAKPAFAKLQDLWVDAEAAVREDSGAYASIAAAGTSAYNFSDNIQIDLIDYLTILEKSDYENEIGSDKEIEDVIHTVQGCVLYRNKNSAEGVNGMAFAFPYQAIGAYTDTHEQLDALGVKKERKAFDVIFSIMAAQQKKAAEDPEYQENMLTESVTGGENPMNALVGMMTADMTQEDWYIKGFEDYDTTDALVDIPLQETADGFRIEAPDKIWNIVSDVQTMVYRNASGGKKVYLGRDHIGAEDADGHPLIGMDETWVHIGGQLVCYEAEPVKETKKGNIFSGKVRAKLNGTDDIILNIEWDPAKDGEEPTKGHITGYKMDSDSLFESIFSSREAKDLEAGDSLQFLFDVYDAEGNLVKTAAVGDKVRVTKQGRIKVEDAPIAGEVYGPLSIGGVLTDIYQRTMTTEVVEIEVE